MEQGSASEDCLYLNIWRPAGAAQNPRPVLVWMHGGGFREGSGAVPIYDGAALADRGVIVVTVNYRLGVFGFLAHPELTQEGPGSGNYGFLDTVEALRWVKANIRAFGGDPDQVTIAGQSAGSILVHHLIASPAAKGLFARAIAQSGSGVGINGSIIPSLTLAEAEADGRRLTDALGAGSVAELRALPPDAVMAAGKASGPAGRLRFAPLVDDHLIPAAARGTPPVNDVPVLTGLTVDEAAAIPRYHAQTLAELQARIERFGALASEAAALYPARNDQEAHAAAKRLIRESGQAATFLWAEQRFEVSRQPTYLYLYTHAEPGPDSVRYGAFHSSDIPYIFQTFRKSPERGFTAADGRISDLMASYWVNFIKAGDPNARGLPAWPAFDPTQPRMMELGDAFRPVTILDEPRRGFFRRHVSSGGWLGIL